MTDYQKAREAAEAAMLKAVQDSGAYTSDDGLVDGCVYFDRVLDAALSAFEAHGWVLRPATTISPTTNYSLSALQERQKK